MVTVQTSPVLDRHALTDKAETSLLYLYSVGIPSDKDLVYSTVFTDSHHSVPPEAWLFSLGAKPKRNSLNRIPNKEFSDPVSLHGICSRASTVLLFLLDLNFLFCKMGRMWK